MLFMPRLCLLFSVLLALFVLPARSQVNKPSFKPGPTPTPATLSAPEYRRQLDKHIAELRRLEKALGRPLKPWLQNRAKDQVIKREDGATQKVSGSEWDRRALDAKGRASKQEVQAAIQSLQARRKALSEWTTRDANGRYFQGADAQTRVAQLENNGTIRTGPTAFQKWMDGAMKWFGKTIEKFFRWMSGALPSAPSGSVPAVNPELIQGLFYLTVIALLGAIGYLLLRPLIAHWDRWRFFWRRSDARRKVEWTGEDAELLQMPPDELLERARAFAAQGNFREALRHHYIRLLLQLDARGVWRYDTRRTNWEHIAALQKNPAHQTLAKPIGDLTRRFDRVRYGNAPCSNDDWQRFERDATAVENSLGAN
jgi:hypothetical protein